MPYGKRKRTSRFSRRRRTFRKFVGRRKTRFYRRRGRLSTTFTRTPAIVGDRAFVKLKYFDSWSLSSASSVAKYYDGTSPYDPDYTLGGVSAVGFAEYKTFFNKYVCMACAIEIQLFNGASSTLELQLIPTTNNAIFATAVQVQAQPYGQMRPCGSINGGHDIVTMKGYMTSSKLFGVPKKAILTESDYSGLTTTDPGIPWYWAVNVSDPSSGTLNCRIYVRMKFYVCFYDRLPIYS